MLLAAQGPRAVPSTTVIRSGSNTSGKTKKIVTVVRKTVRKVMVPRGNATTGGGRNNNKNNENNSNAISVPPAPAPAAADVAPIIRCVPSVVAVAALGNTNVSPQRMKSGGLPHSPRGEANRREGRQDASEAEEWEGLDDNTPLMPSEGAAHFSTSTSTTNSISSSRGGDAKTRRSAGISDVTYHQSNDDGHQRKHHGTSAAATAAMKAAVTRGHRTAEPSSLPPPPFGSPTAHHHRYDFLAQPVVPLSLLHTSNPNSHTIQHQLLQYQQHQRYQQRVETTSEQPPTQHVPSGSEEDNDRHNNSSSCVYLPPAAKMRHAIRK